MARNADGNRLLAALNEDERARLLEGSQMVDADIGYMLYEANKPIEHVYFPHAGVMSVVTEVDDGTTVEVPPLAMRASSACPSSSASVRRQARRSRRCPAVCSV